MKYCSGSTLLDVGGEGDLLGPLEELGRAELGTGLVGSGAKEGDHAGSDQTLGCEPRRPVAEAQGLFGQLRQAPQLVGVAVEAPLSAWAPAPSSVAKVRRVTSTAM